MIQSDKTALVIGGSRGVGRALTLRLAQAGLRTIAVARDVTDLDAVAVGAGAIETRALDATTDGVAQALIAEFRPDYLFLVGGVQPKMSPLTDQSWQEFSRPWNVDTKIAFDFIKAALLVPMPEGEPWSVSPAARL